MLQRANFPSDFLWGAATSAYQIEGATDQGGRGTSIWDTFSATPGKVRGGDSGAIACDFYNRYREDVALMRELGLDAFRFSIAWPRILPEGRGAVNAAGLDFYDRLVDELLAAGIQPSPTLYHWDLPQALEDAGGWPERATAEAFAEYSGIVAQRLGDRVREWTTHNEPYCASWLGYIDGVHAPGRTDLAAGIAAAHHVLLSHGLAVEALRRESPGAQVGIVIDSWPQHPATADERDVAAAREADGFRNRLYFDPVLLGTYPEDVLELLGPAAPPVRDGDLATISMPIDYLGVNNYSRQVVRAGADGRPVTVPPNGPVTAMGWEVYPESLHEVLTRLHREYAAPPMYVTENGAAFDDVVSADGAVHDQQRIDYLSEHFAQAKRAITDGVDLRGYFVWSLMDNFEWAWGYERRFGLIHIDYETQARTVKDSGHWYASRISAHVVSTAATG